jgi:hypothetical protein
MTSNLATVAFHAHGWSLRQDFSEPLRNVARIILQLIDDIAAFDPLPEDALDTIRVLSCDLCRRAGRPPCQAGAAGSPCRLGWPRAADTT